MRAGYRQWLERQKYGANTIANQISHASRVEKHYGDLDEHYATDGMASLIASLRYTTDDKRHNRPNPSKIPFDGDIPKNLACYRNAVGLYRRFREADGDAVDMPLSDGVGTAGTAKAEEEIGQRMGLERDMQAALRVEIGQLEPGLTIIDDGVERSVESGFIDITARDAQGRTVVIELKAGSAGQRAVVQVLSYMGDVLAEEGGGDVRGILVASDFDAKAKAAARMVPGLILRRYSVRFLFSDGHAT